MDKNKIGVDSATFKFLYTRYKEFAIPLIVIIVSTVVLITVVMPQFQNLLDLSRKTKESEKNLEVLKQNFDVLSSLDEKNLDSQLRTVSVALPGNKDFIGIINAISFASSVAGVGVGDFQITVGELSGNESSSSDSSSASVSLNVSADFEGVSRFLNMLANTFPLSEVTSVSTGDFSSSVTVDFHHKPFPPTRIEAISPIVSISSEDLSLINKLVDFNYIPSYEFSIFEEATSSSRLQPEGVLR